MPQFQATLRTQQHVLAVVMEGVAAGLLGCVHRRIGGAQQAVEIRQAFTLQRDADAGAELEGDVFLAQRLTERSNQLARHMAGVFRLGHIAQQHDEFVVAEAAEQVAIAQMLMQARRGELEQVVAGGVAKRIVDAFEAIQINQQHRQYLAALVRLANGVFCLFAQQEAVRQAGQAVVMREQLDPFVGFAFAGNIAEQRHKPRRQALATVQLDQHLHPDELAGLR